MTLVRSLIAPSRRVKPQQRDVAEQLQILLTGLIAASLGAYGLMLALGDGADYWLLPVFASALLVCYGLARLGRVRLSSVLLLLTVEGLTIWFQLTHGVGTHISYFSLIFVAVAWLLLGTAGGLGFAVVVSMVTLLLAGRELQAGGSPDLLSDMLSLVVTLLGLSIVLWLFAHRLQRAYSRLLVQDQHTSEYQLAQQIQQGLLRGSIPQPETGRLLAWCQPAQEISGDFYDVIKLSKGRLGIVVGDVCGKGLPAALLMNLARTTIRAEAQHSGSAALALSRVSAALSQDLLKNQFIALSYAIFEARSSRLRLSNAGQLEPILLRGGRIQYLSTPGERLPLGLGVERRYDELTVQLQPGDRVFFYTDGALEAQSASGELFGFERLQTLLQRTRAGASAIDRLQRDLARFTGDAGPHDDITAVELDLSVIKR